MISAADSALAQALTALGLRAVAAQLREFIAKDRKTVGARSLLEEIVAAERDDRTKRSLERRQKRSKIGDFKPVDQFDWNFPTVLNRAKIKAVLDLDFYKDALNVIFAGPHGTGKTTLSKNVAHQAILAGYSVIFISAARLLSDLTATDSRRRLEARLKYYAALDLLAIDLW